MGVSIVRDENESLVNTSTSGTQRGPHVVQLTGGNAVVVWEDSSGEGGDASGTSIKLRVYDATTGDPLSADVLVNTSTNSNQDFPNIAALAGGGFVVVWHDASGSGGDASGTGVKAQRFDASGNKLGAELLVNTTTGDAQAYASVAGLAGGGFVVTWEDESQYGSNATDVLGQVFGADGTKSGAEFVVSTTVTADQWHPRVTGLSGGGFAVTWYDFSGSGGDYSGSAVKLQLFSAGGAKQGSETLVNTSTSGNQQYSSLAQLTDGNFVVVWEDSSGSGGDASPPAIKAQLFTASGTRVGSEFLVNTSTSSSQINARVTALGDGFVVVWEDYSGSGGDASGAGIKAQVFDASGNRLGVETLVNGITASNQTTPDVTALDANTFGVTWVDNSGALGDASSGGIVALDLKLLQTPVAVADTATISEETGKAAFFVLDNDSPLSTLSALGTITVSSTLAGLDAADLTATIVDDRIEVSFGNQFRHLASGQNATVVIPHTVTDGAGDSATTQLTVTVLGANTLAPVTPAEGEFRINTTRDDTQESVRTTLLSDGSFIVVWEDYSSNFGDPDSAVVAQRFYSDGARMGGEFLVSPAGPGGATYGEAAALPGGGFMIVWEDHSSAHPDADGGIIGQLFDANSNPSGLPFQVNTTTTGPQFEPRVATLQNGNVVVTWSSTPDGFFGSMDVFAQILSPTGAPVGGEFAVQTQSAQGQLLPTIAVLSNGNFVITWSTRDPAADGSDAAVKAQLFSPSGTKLGSEFLVNTTTAGFQSRPYAAAFDDGGFVIAWHSAADSAVAETFDIRAQRYDNLGNKVGAEFLANTTLAGGQRWPAVETLADGRFLISWSDTSGRLGDADGEAVVAQLFDRDGSRLGSEFLVNTSTTGDQFAVAPILALDASRVLVVWNEASGGISGSELADPGNLKGRIFTLAQTTDGSDVVDMTGPGGGTVFGGPGDDIYIVDDPLDNPVEGPGEGRDTVRAGLNWKLGPSFEVLELTGNGTLTGWGNTGSNTVVGNGAANELYGEDTPDWSAQRGGVDTLIGGAGNDRYFVDNPNDTVIESNTAAALRPAAGRFGATLLDDDGRPFDLGDDADTIVASLGRAVLAAFVENGELAEGTAAREAIGNELANDLSGNAAGNLFHGAIGNDTLRGGDGVDVATFTGNRSEYTVSQDFTTITDNLGSNGNDGTDTLVGIEVLRFADQVVARSGTTLVQGGALNDAINLGAADNQAGAGGAGDDTYTVNAIGDAVIEYAGGGTDTVQSSVSWTLWENLEHLVLTGTAAIDGAGNTEANRITGNSAANVLFGYQGNDTLEGTGGADTLLGGAGDDLYLADGSDSVSEFANEGTDTVQSASTFSLGNNLEILKLSGTTDANGTGNAGNNRLLGNAGANTLAGADGNDTLEGGDGNDSLDGGAGDDSLDGGPGVDTLAGGAGNDIYIASAGDAHVEQAGGGSDTVQSAITWTLGAQIEKLVLTGSAAVNGTGSAGANALTGNAAANQLNGGGGNDTLSGGAGIDTLTGGAGNDTYLASAGDKIVEVGGGGTDTVQSALSWTLAANVEKLLLTGAKAINGTGSGSNNTLTGNNAGNTLSGLGGVDILQGQGGNDVLKGGAGNDRLFGGTGADAFVFDTALGVSNVDTLPDFNPAQDVIHLDNAVFSALAAGALAPAQFRAGTNLTAAQDADDRIVYNTTTGALYYDADGAGGTAAIRFAGLGSEGSVPTLTAADFLVT